MRSLLVLAASLVASAAAAHSPSLSINTTALFFELTTFEHKHFDGNACYGQAYQDNSYDE